MKETAVLSAAAPRITVEEYLSMEERSDIRHEFIQNQMIPMPGTTDIHNDICFNIKLALKQLLNNPAFRIFVEGVKVQIKEGKDYTYPDVFVTSDPRDLADRYIKRYPSVIFEVLSKTSRIEDASDKFIRYTNIGSLQNYLLVDSEKMFVELRIKLEDGHWETSTFLPSDVRFPVPALGLELDFASVYEGVF